MSSLIFRVLVVIESILCIGALYGLLISGFCHVYASFGDSRKQLL